MSDIQDFINALRATGRYTEPQIWFRVVLAIGRVDYFGWGTSGHPLARKLVTSSNPRGNTPGKPYAGYCSGARETTRRRGR